MKSIMNLQLEALNRMHEAWIALHELQAAIEKERSEYEELSQLIGSVSAIETWLCEPLEEERQETLNDYDMEVYDDPYPWSRR